MNNSSSQNKQNTSHDFDTIDLIELFISILKKWYVFVVIGVVALAIAVYAILSTAPQYSTEGTLLIKAKKDMMSIATEQFSIASDLLGGTSSVEDEMIILRSKTLTKQMVETLSLQESCIYIKRLGSEHELYNNAPIVIIYPEGYKQSIKGSLRIRINKKENGSWNIKFRHKYQRKRTKYQESVTDLTQPINTPWGEFKFIEVERFIDEKYPNYKLEFVLQSVKSRTEEYNEKLKVNLSSKKANAISISIISGSIPRNEEIINQIIKLYKDNLYNDKLAYSLELEKFINDRINIINAELEIIERKVEDFRLNNNLANIEIQSRNAIEAARDYEKLITEVDMEYTLMTFIENHIKKSDLLDLIPSNTGISDEALSNLIISYNYEVMEYLRLTRSTNESNPYISQLKSKILLSRENILQTITNMKEGTLLRKEDIIKKNKQVSSVINNVPTLEREYVEVAREQEIKRNIYLFLLQKREETQLALSSSTSTIKIADYAYTTEKPTSPNKKLTLVTAMFCTIILGFIYIYVSSVITSYNDKKKKKTN